MGPPSPKSVVPPMRQGGKYTPGRGPQMQRIYRGRKERAAGHPQEHLTGRIQRQLDSLPPDVLLPPSP